MKRKRLPDPKLEQLIITMFKEGHVIQHVKRVTDGSFDDGVYERLRLASLA